MRNKKGSKLLFFLLFMAVGKEVLWEQRAELGELMQTWYPLTHTVF